MNDRAANERQCGRSGACPGYRQFSPHHKQRKSVVRWETNHAPEKGGLSLVTTAAVTTATAATTAAVFAPRTTITSAAAAAGSLLARARDVHRKSAAVKFLAVQGVNGLLRLFGRAHGDERESTGATRHPVHHQVGFHDRSVRGKCVLEVVFSSFEGKISYKQLCAHVMSTVRDQLCYSPLFPTAGFQIITEPKFT